MTISSSYILVKEWHHTKCNIKVSTRNSFRSKDGGHPLPPLWASWLADVCDRRLGLRYLTDQTPVGAPLGDDAAHHLARGLPGRLQLPGEPDLQAGEGLRA